MVSLLHRATIIIHSGPYVLKVFENVRGSGFDLSGFQ